MTQVSVYPFSLKHHNISVTPKMVEKVIMNLDSSKASGPDYIPVEVLKNCEPKLSYSNFHVNLNFYFSRIFS